jgi:hypothetical protein
MTFSSERRDALPPMICQVCQRVLDALIDIDGVRYQHTAHDDTGDHEAVPVPAAAGWSGGRCDFCGAGQPTYELPAQDFQVPILDHLSRGAWAACDGCADLVRRGWWRALLRQAIAQAEQRHGTTLDAGQRSGIAELYRRLRRNVTGPLRSIKRS